MNEPQSLSDQAVETLAAVRAMNEDLKLEHPERHALREMKRIAENILSEAFRQARMLAMAADTVREAAREAEKDKQ